MSEPTPFLDLVARATPGPWIHLKWERGIYTRLNDGCRGSLIAQVADADAPRCQADAQLIARIASPDVALKVYVALRTGAHDLEASGLAFDHPSVKRLRDTLNLLDGAK